MLSGKHASLGLWGTDANDYMSPDTLGADTAIRNSAFRTKGAFVRLGYAGVSLEYIFSHAQDVGRPRDDPNRTATYDKDYHDVIRLGYEGVALGMLWRASVWGHQKQKVARVIKDKPSDSLTTTEITWYNGTDAGASLMATTYLGPNILTLGTSAFARRNLDIRMRTTKVQWVTDSILDDTTEFPTLDGQYTEAGVFFMDEVPLWVLKLRAGFRGDYMGWGAGDQTSQNRIALTGEFGVLCPLPLGFQLIASSRRSYRAPELRELFFTGETPRGYQYANPDLSPELGLSGEAGLRWSSSTFWADGEVFYTHIDSMLVKDVYYDGDSIVFKNTGKAFLKGFELETGASMGRVNLSVFGFAMEGRDMAGLSPLDDIVAPTWGTNVSCDFGPCCGINAIVPWLRLRGRAAKVDPGPNELVRQAFWLLDGGLDVSFLQGRLGLNIGVENALNRFYYDNADAKAVANPGRNIGLGISGRF